ncbi:unnamed protein product [Polarella glacialis]|uniref:Uncharacterized protein n=1 Tax=Polarella glacialis TaxID=89957 RepID=A0A813LIJ2_POLGL|nr:unnamed protein product [Polarella glacialis]
MVSRTTTTATTTITQTATTIITATTTTTTSCRADVNEHCRRAVRLRKCGCRRLVLEIRRPAGSYEEPSQPPSRAMGALSTASSGNKKKSQQEENNNDYNADSDAELLLSAGADGKIRLWDLASGLLLRLLLGHKEVVWRLAADWSTGLIVSSSHDRTLRLWDLGSETCQEQSGAVLCDTSRMDESFYGQPAKSGLGGEFKGSPLADISDEAVANLAFFCHVFKVLSSETFEVSSLLPLRVAELVTKRAAATSQLGKVLPLLAALQDTSLEAAQAMRHVVERSLPAILASKGQRQEEAAGLHERESIPRLLEALALARQRDLGLVTGLATRCLRLAPRLDLAGVLRVADSLARLGVRQELLLNELADNIVVRHQRSLTFADVEALLAAWTKLRAPHRDLAQAIQKWIRAASHEGSAQSQFTAQRLERQLQEFASLTAPGSSSGLQSRGGPAELTARASP